MSFSRDPVTLAALRDQRVPGIRTVAGAGKMSSTNPSVPLELVEVTATAHLELRDDAEPGTGLAILPVWITLQMYVGFSDGWVKPDGLNQFVTQEFASVDFGLGKCEALHRDQRLVPLPEAATNDTEDEEDDYFDGEEDDYEFE